VSKLKLLLLLLISFIILLRGSQNHALACELIEYSNTQDYHIILPNVRFKIYPAQTSVVWTALQMGYVEWRKFGYL